MYYEINVAGPDHTGKMTHLFATAERSLTFLSDAVRVYDMIKARFPEPEFDVTLTQYSTSGWTLTADDIAKERNRR